MQPLVATESDQTAQMGGRFRGSGTFGARFESFILCDFRRLLEVIPQRKL